jgi:hypothetical protein
MLCENSQKEVVIENPKIPWVTIEDEELEFILDGLDSLYESLYKGESKANRVLEFKNKLLDASKEHKTGEVISEKGSIRCKVCDD